MGTNGGFGRGGGFGNNQDVSGGGGFGGSYDRGFNRGQEIREDRPNENFSGGRGRGFGTTFGGFRKGANEQNSAQEERGGFRKFDGGFADSNKRSDSRSEDCDGSTGGGRGFRNEAKGGFNSAFGSSYRDERKSVGNDDPGDRKGFMRDNSDFHGRGGRSSRGGGFVEANEKGFRNGGAGGFSEGGGRSFHDGGRGGFGRGADIGSGGNREFRSGGEKDGGLLSDDEKFGDSREGRFSGSRGGGFRNGDRSGFGGGRERFGGGSGFRADNSRGGSFHDVGERSQFNESGKFDTGERSQFNESGKFDTGGGRRSEFGATRWPREGMEERMRFTGSGGFQGGDGERSSRFCESGGFRSGNKERFGESGGFRNIGEGRLKFSESARFKGGGEERQRFAGGGGFRDVGGGRSKFAESEHFGSDDGIDDRKGGRLSGGFGGGTAGGGFESRFAFHDDHPREGRSDFAGGRGSRFRGGSGGFASRNGAFGDGGDGRGFSRSAAFGSSGFGRSFEGGGGFRSNEERNAGNAHEFRNSNSGRYGKNQGDGYGRNDNGIDVRRARSTYVPDDRPLEEMYEEDASNAKYEVGDLDMEVTITGVPQLEKDRKLQDWESANFEQLLLKNVKKCSYAVPRRIQAAVIPLIMNGWDLFGHAETGSGKTLAFILPIIDGIMKKGAPENSLNAPVALIVAPTRELVSQLYNQTRKVAEGTGVTVAQCYGRTDVAKCLSDIQRGCNILVATPGRLMDFVSKGRVHVRNVEYFILDEADRMLNVNGFQSNMLDLTRTREFPTSEQRQTMLFSATFDTEVQQFARQLLKSNFAFVSNGKTTSANPRVQQNFIQVSKAEKLNKLCELLEEERAKSGDVCRTLVFVTRKVDTDTVAMYLSSNGIRACSIHGDREQDQREKALKEFRSGTVKVLLATDVCARGIDVNNLEHVINYDLPTEWIIYVHRIGRTGRMHAGKATSFIDSMEHGDRAMAPDLLRIVREVQQEAPQFLIDLAEGLGGLAGTTSRGGETGGSFGGGGFAKGSGGFASSGSGFASASGGGFASASGGGGFASSKPSPKGGFAGGVAKSGFGNAGSAKEAAKETEAEWA